MEEYYSAAPSVNQATPAARAAYGQRLGLPILDGRCFGKEQLGFNIGLEPRTECWPGLYVPEAMRARPNAT
jgi:hypothetical protein